VYDTSGDHDVQLWQKLKNGDTVAFQQIYEMHINSLSLYCRRFTKDLSLIEDTLHDVFVQLWTRRESLGMTNSIVKYLTVTVRREMVRRVQKGYQTTGFEIMENQNVGFTFSPEESIVFRELDEERSKKLEKAMNILSDRQKEALYLRYFENMSYEEICETMDIHYQSVRNLISKGIIEMRKFLECFLWLAFYHLF
jgi:RNA polymerase sigma factor (sigma-70 family)